MKYLEYIINQKRLGILGEKHAYDYFESRWAARKVEGYDALVIEGQSGISIMSLIYLPYVAALHFWNREQAVRSGNRVGERLFGGGAINHAIEQGKEIMCMRDTTLAYFSPLQMLGLAIGGVVCLSVSIVNLYKTKQNKINYENNPNQTVKTTDNQSHNPMLSNLIRKWVNHTFLSTNERREEQQANCILGALQNHDNLLAVIGEAHLEGVMNRIRPQIIARAVNDSAREYDSLHTTGLKIQECA